MRPSIRTSGSFLRWTGFSNFQPDAPVLITSAGKMGPSKLTAFHAKPDAATVRHLEQSSHEKDKPKSVVCGNCGATVGEHKIRHHRARKCPNRKVRKTLTADSPSPRSLATVSPLRTATHPPQEPESLIAAELAGLQTGTLDFELLPPGSWTAQDLIDYFEKNADLWRVRFQGRPFDPDRLKQICSLDPFRCWKGKKGFFGYIVFEFYIPSRVVLECRLRPQCGLEGVGLSKQERDQVVSSGPV